jgi:MoaA/NifB/PqqE/SkfB family radical SAM enzyme
MNDPHRLGSLPILILYPHSRCDCRCVMCDIWMARETQEISAQDLERLAADIETLGVRQVVFSGGEPLLHSDLFGLNDMIRVRGVGTTILTSGLLLAHHAFPIAHSTNETIVSLDGPEATHDRIRRVPGAFRMLASGVKALHDRKPDYPVRARCTVQRLNFSFLRETVRAARELGLESISFLAADVTTTAFNRPSGWSAARRAQIALTAEETTRLDDEIGMLIEELPKCTGFVLETPEKLRRIALHFRAQAGLAEAIAPRCNAPWVSAVVESDGTVRPCFFHEPIGNAKEEALIEVVNGRKAVEYRRALDVSRNPVCRRCVCSLNLA